MGYCVGSKVVESLLRGVLYGVARYVSYRIFATMKNKFG